MIARRCPAVVGLLLLAPTFAVAQLAPANPAGMTFSHIHLNVTEVELHRTLLLNLLEGAVVRQGDFEAISIPGALIFLTEHAPTHPSIETTVDHVGFKVRDLEETLARWRSLGYDVDAEFVGGEGFPQAYITLPNGTRVELAGVPDLTRSSEMHHVHFYSPEHVEHLEWWVDLIDGSRTARGSIETTMDVPGTNLSFGPADGVHPTAGTAVDHVGLEVDDIHAFADRVRRRGVEFEVEPFLIDEVGVWVAFFVDPAGVRVEVSQGLDRFGGGW